MNQITISKETMSVFVNGSSILDLPITIPNGVLNLYWFDGKEGFINNTDGTTTKITAFPAWAQQCVEVYNQHLPIPAPAPSPQEINKQQAQADLYATDWTSIPDITDPAKCTPTLLNQADFLTYRNQLRAIAINPPATLVQLPVKPEPKWSA